MMRVGALLTGACLLFGCSGDGPEEDAISLDARAVADSLLAADRAFAAHAASADLVTGISAMFAPDVRMPVPPAGWAEDSASAVAALRANPANEGARAEWVPIRVGISADGQHGFTFGYITTTRADGTTVPGKYMTYWVRTPEGWRAAAYKRAGRAEGDVGADPMPAAIPPRTVPPTADAALIERYAASLDSTESAFSDDAQEIGLGPAFLRYGSADAVNMGPGAEYTVGAEAISRLFQPDTAGSPVSWGADHVRVASSGDLGITFGMIRQNGPAPDAAAPSAIPFFTIWRRAGPTDPWRYVAE